MLKDLVRVANRLDSLGLSKEADLLDSYIIKMAGGNWDDETGIEIHDEGELGDLDQPETNEWDGGQHPNNTDSDQPSHVYVTNLLTGLTLVVSSGVEVYKYVKENLGWEPSALLITDNPPTAEDIAAGRGDIEVSTYFDHQDDTLE